MQITSAPNTANNFLIMSWHNRLTDDQDSNLHCHLKVTVAEAFCVYNLTENTGNDRIQNNMYMHACV